MPAGVLAVHQLRYWLAYGSRSAVALQNQGHSYLHSLVPWIVLLAALAVGGFLLALGRAFGGNASLPRYTLSFTSLWLLCSAGLIALYAGQESLEGLLATGHPGGWAGVFGYGGWWAIPAALAVGLILAASFHGARSVLRALAERRSRPDLAVPRAPSAARRRPDAWVPPLTPLANGCSVRGPPA